jgi:type I restriction enzyme, S subunit
MNWKKVKIGSFLKERVGRYKPAEANATGLKRIEKIDFSGTYHLVDKPTNTDMILVKKGDLLISGINAEKGAVTIYSDDKDALATIHYSSYEFDKSKININYFKWFLISDAFKNLLKASAGGGIKTELKAKHLLPLEINLPPVNEQTLIVEGIKARHHKLTVLKKELDQQQTYLQLLRQTILKKAVQGKLTKQNPTGEPATELLKRIKAEKEKLIKAGKLKKEKELPPITENEIPFKLPEGWIWCRL